MASIATTGHDGKPVIIVSGRHVDMDDDDVLDDEHNRCDWCGNPMVDDLSIDLGRHLSCDREAIAAAGDHTTCPACNDTGTVMPDGGRPFDAEELATAREIFPCPVCRPDDYAAVNAAFGGRS